MSSNHLQRSFFSHQVTSRPSGRVSSRTRPCSPTTPSAFRPATPTSPKSTRTPTNRAVTPSSPNLRGTKARGLPHRTHSPVTPTEGNTAIPFPNRRAESPGTSGIPRKMKYVVNVVHHNSGGGRGMGGPQPLSPKEGSSPTGGIFYRSTTQGQSSSSGVVNQGLPVNFRDSSPKACAPSTQRRMSPNGAAQYRGYSDASTRRKDPLPSAIPRREPSPTVPSTSPSPSVTRRASPNGSNPRQASPSNRGASPNSGIIRGASPGSRSSSSGVSEEVVRGRVRRAVRARLYLLHQPGPNSFSVGGDSPTHKYKVIIGPQVRRL